MRKLTINVSVGAGLSKTLSAVVTVAGVFSAVQGVLVVSVGWGGVVGRGWVVLGSWVVSVVRGRCVTGVLGGGGGVGGQSGVSAVGVVGAGLGTDSGGIQGGWETTGEGAVVGGGGKRQRASYYCLKEYIANLYREEEGKHTRR